MFSGLDAFLELVTFVGMSIFLALSVELKVLPVALCFLREMNLFSDVLRVSGTLLGCAMSFLLYFSGVDPALVTFGDDSSEGDLRGCSWVSGGGEAVEGNMTNTTTATM